jgi:hypothetical protein
MDLHGQRTALLAYLKAKVEAADWHGVSDAANDLRVLEAQIALTPIEIDCDALHLTVHRNED